MLDRAANFSGARLNRIANVLRQPRGFDAVLFQKLLDFETIFEKQVGAGGKDGILTELNDSEFRGVDLFQGMNLLK